MASGQSFVEFANEEVANFALRYLNNYELVPTKGLIVDYSMEDQRALFKRKEKIERWRNIAKETKMEKLAEEAKTKPKAEEAPALVELGKRDKSESKKDKGDQKTGIIIAEINDIPTLKKMAAETKSRGQRQRIHKKIDRLEGKDTSKPDESKTGPVQTAKDKINSLLKKREEKLAAKEYHKKAKGLNPEEKAIKNQIIKQKKIKNKEMGTNEDEFDKNFEKYQEKLLKRLEQATKEESGGAPFEEVDVDYD